MTVCFYIPVGLLIITTLMYYRFLCIVVVQSTPNNSILRGNRKRFELSGAQKKQPGVRKKQFYCIVNILVTFNPPYRKRWRLNILPQFLSNITQPITHKVIFWGGEIRPCNSNIAYPRFEVYKTFLCVFMSNFMVFIC